MDVPGVFRCLDVIDRLGIARILDVDDALRELAKANERYAKVVELRWFGGLTVDEVAVLLDLTPRTVHLDWRSARAWLRQTLEDRESI